MWKKAIFFLMATGSIMTYGKASSLALVSFPDSAGVIIKQDTGCVVRQIEGKRSGKTNAAEAIFRVWAPASTVYKVVNSCEQYPEFMPLIKEVVPVSDSAKRNLYRFTLRALLFPVSYTVSIKDRCLPEGDTCFTSWEYLEGDLKDNSGSWQVWSDPADQGCCLVRYRVFIEPKGLMPAGMISHLTSKSIPRMVEAIRNRVSSVVKGKVK